jgi:nucleotide-binding universal stress UspA family protein
MKEQASFRSGDYWSCLYLMDIGSSTVRNFADELSEYSQLALLKRKEMLRQSSAQALPKLSQEEAAAPATDMRVQRILCPIDLATGSNEALRYAITLSRAYDAKLFIFHCVRTSGLGMIGDEAQQILAARDEVTRRVSGLFETDYSPPVLNASHWEPSICLCENPGDAIVSEASKRNADLIVMRSRRRPHRAALLGSTAEQVCRTASCPVLVTHAEEREWVKGRNIQLKRVLVAYDFSDFSEFALNYALSFAQEYQAELHLLHVLPPAMVQEPEISWYPMGQEGAYHIAARRLQKAVPAETHLWCNVRHIVSEGQPYREILNYAESNKIDLICIGAHGAGFGMRTLFGSNVDRVLRQAPCPVLVARPLKPETRVGQSSMLHASKQGLARQRAAS